MAITFNDNLNISAQKPVDNRFGPFANTSTALAAIPAGQRYIGLTVGIGTNPVVEYWFNDGILDGDFVPKTASGNLTGITAGTGIAVSGSATNPTIAVTTPTQLTTNISTDVIVDQASDIKYPSVKAVKTYVDGLTVGLLNDRGSYAPSSTSPGPYPSTGGSGGGGAILKGDLWYIRSDGYLGTTFVSTGASVRALINSPSPTVDANWDILDAGLGYVPENEANKVTSGSSITSDPTNPTTYPSVKALTEYLTTFTPTVPTLQSVVTSAIGANISTGVNLVVRNTSTPTRTSSVSSGSILLQDTDTSRSIGLGTDDRIRVQVGTSYTTYEATRITFNGPGYTSTLQAQSGNQIMYLPSPPSASRTLALSVNGNFADTSGNITLPSSVGSGTPFKLTMWNSPSGTAIVDSNITNNGSNTSIGIFNDGTKLSAGKYGVQIGIGYPSTMSYPYETLVVSDATSTAGIGVYCVESTPGAGSASIFLGNEEYTTGGGYYISSQTSFVNSTSALSSTVTNNFLYRDLAGSIVESVTDILKIWGDGTVSLQASGTGSLNTAYPRLVINEDPSVVPSTGIKLYVNGEVSVPNGIVDAGGFSSTNFAGTGTGLILASNVGILGRATLPTGTLNRIPKWTATGSLSLGDSQIFDNGTSVGINNTSPGADYKLDVTGKSKFSDVLQVGATVPFSGLITNTGNATTNIEANIVTDKAIATTRGINISAIGSNPANKTGFYAAGNRVELFAGTNRIGSFGLFTSTGAFLQLDGAFVPANASQAGSLNGLRLQHGVLPNLNTNNTTAQTQAIIDPTINQINGSGTGSGTLRGVYYNPTITNIGGSANKHIAIETVSGDVLLGTGSYTSANGGYVGIGSGWIPGNAVTMPRRPLHIRDVMRLEPRATEPSSPSAGDIYYDSTVNKLRIYNGTSWRYVQFEP